MIPARSRAEGTAGPTAFIFDIMRFATHDGPGIRTAVFFKGCPLACPWCHNPESQSYRPDAMYFEERCRRCGDCVPACPEHAIERVDGIPRTSLDVCRRCGQCRESCPAEARRIAGRRITLRGLIAEIEKDLVFFEESGGGVTLSGGEPLSQPRFVSALLRACRERGIHTAIETCGFAPSSPFLEAALLADLVLFDLKLMDPEIHKRFTGVSNARILANLEALVARGRAVTVRIAVVPGINDGEGETRRFAQYLAGLRIAGVELLPYHRIGVEKYKRLGMAYRLEDTPPPAPAEMDRFAGALAQAGLRVTIGGWR